MLFPIVLSTNSGMYDAEYQTGVLISTLVQFLISLPANYTISPMQTEHKQI